MFFLGLMVLGNCVTSVVLQPITSALTGLRRWASRKTISESILRLHIEPLRYDKMDPLISFRLTIY